MTHAHRGGWVLTSGSHHLRCAERELDRALDAFLADAPEGATLGWVIKAVPRGLPDNDFNTLYCSTERECRKRGRWADA